MRPTGRYLRKNGQQGRARCCDSILLRDFHVDDGNNRCDHATAAHDDKVFEFKFHDLSQLRIRIFTDVLCGDEYLSRITSKITGQWPATYEKQNTPGPLRRCRSLLARPITQHRSCPLAILPLSAPLQVALPKRRGCPMKCKRLRCNRTGFRRLIRGGHRLLTDQDVR